MLNFCVISLLFWEIVLRRNGMLLLKNSNPILNVEIAVASLLLFRRVIYS
jgi:hypothetical protein